MKSILVVGTPERLEEFKLLKIQNAEILYADPSEVHAQEPDETGLFDEFFGDDFLMGDDFDEDFDEDEDDDDDFVVVEDDEDEEDDDDDEVGDGVDVIDTSSFDIVFDLNLDEDPDSFETYLLNDDQIVIGCAVTATLSSMAGIWGDLVSCTFVGMNALPTFINRPKLELSLFDKADLMALESTMKVLGLEYELVADEIGMVTPRIVCMIINEACFVLGEGTADIAAVDQAMKLGTNYPKGPFEWADEIGIEHVYNLLEALLAVTGDGKYKIAPRLRKHHEMYAPFYH